MPKLLLLDEPLGALDRKLREETRLELTGIQERVGTTFLVVTHDQEEALGLASRIAVMNRGRLVQIGTPAEIYERPTSRFVADFVGAVNLFEGTLVAGSARSLVAGIEPPVRCRASETLPAGAAAALAVRPEKLRLSLVRPDRFAFAATVISVGYRAGNRPCTCHRSGAGIARSPAKRGGAGLHPRHRGVGELAPARRGGDHGMSISGRLLRFARNDSKRGCHCEAMFPYLTN